MIGKDALLYAFLPPLEMLVACTSDHENVPLSLCVGTDDELRTIHVSGIN